MTPSLRRPGAVAADIEGRLVVSDTGAHRVLVGHVLANALDVRRVVGSGEPGFEDGAFDETRFDGPEGLALSGDMLIVADRGNHAIRMIDLAAGNVGTMAGTGERAEAGVAGGDPLTTALDSPWDVLLNEYDLYIAMGGTGEVWRLDLKEGALVSHLDRVGDGEHAPGPMALASDGTWLYVADAPSSTVRRVRFDGEGEAETLVDEELVGCSGVAWGQGNHRLWVSDTGAGLLKMLDPDSRLLEPVEPFEAELDHPAGLASAGHLLYVADKRHDRVVRVDQVDKRVVELEIEEIEGMVHQEREAQ